MEPTRQQRIIGALLGVHAGDSLGASFEFTPWEEIRRTHPSGKRDITGGGPFDWPAGHATDDTDLTRAVLLAYLDRHQAAAAAAGSRVGGAGDTSLDVATRAGSYMLDWLEGRWPSRAPGSFPRDAGGATLQGLAAFKASRDVRRTGAGMGQAGNGSLMRCIPTACFAADRAALVRESMAISAITHDDPRCTVSCAAYNLMVRELMDGKSPDEAVEGGLEIARELETEGSTPVRDAILLGREIKVVEMAERGPSPLARKASGYVLESLSIAVSAVLDKRSLEDVLVDVVRIGKDTDTNAAIAGGLVGAREGEKAIPEDWRKVLQFADEFVKVAKIMHSS